MCGTSSASPGACARTETIPRTIDRYMVLDQLGHGGMGVVYEAYDPRLDRNVALKLIRADIEPDQQRARLLREAQALARISHPNVLPVHDSGLFAGQAFVAMELVRGQTLRRWLDSTRPGWARVVDTLVTLAEGLAVVHEAGLVHRDIKPENILLDDRDRPLLIDFGLARMLDQPDAGPIGASEWPEPRLDDGRLTRRGAMMGSPSYMAPEQLAGRETGRATDQFGYCVMAWESLFGQRPFDIADPQRRAAAIEAGRPRRPARAAMPGSVARRLARVLARGLAHEPGQRWPSIGCLLEMLRFELRRHRAHRHRGRLAITTAISAVLAAGVGFGAARHGAAGLPSACMDTPVAHTGSTHHRGMDGVLVEPLAQPLRPSPREQAGHRVGEEHPAGSEHE